MGLMGLFGKGPLSEKKIQKVSKLGCNPYAQPDVRVREIRRLLDDGSRAALVGALKRFAVNANGHIADEDEKKWLVDELVAIGNDTLEPLRTYIQCEEKLTYALTAYRRIAGDHQAVELFLEVLAHYGPEDYRSAEAKQQLVWQLSEHLSDPRVLPALCPFLGDHSDEVRWAIIGLFEKAVDDGVLSDEGQTCAAAELAEIVLADHAPPRIQQRAAEFLADREWQLPAGEKNEVADTLGEDYFLDKKRFVRRRARKKT